MEVANMKRNTTGSAMNQSSYKIVEKQIMLNLSELLRKQGLISDEEKMRMKKIINS